jgi:hypothetical protein
MAVKQLRARALETGRLKKGLSTGFKCSRVALRTQVN